MHPLPYLIYRITCLVNDKVYIGQTRQTLKARIGNYRRGLRARPDSNQSILSAMRKHGFNAFVFEEIDRAESPEELNDMERHWIAFYRSTDRDFGYNLQAGGGCSDHHAGMKKGIRCVETGESFCSMAAAARTKGFSPAALTLHMRGQNKTCNGCHWEWTGNAGATIYESKEVRDVFEQTRERQRYAKSGPKAGVRCTETGETFESLTAAGKRYSVDKRAIYTAVERGIAAAGLHWTRLGPKRAHNRRGCKVRQVKNLGTGAVYPSLAEAARSIGLKTGASIWCSIRRGEKAAGERWAYV